MTSTDPTASTTPRGAPRRVAGFTLIEMIVVVAIVVVLIALILPAASTMWEERKSADAEMMIQGMLMTARAKALQASGVESGVFFFVDDRGTQHIVPIQQGPGKRDLENVGNPAWESVFRVVPGRTYSLPAPMRVVPRYVIEEDPDDEKAGRVFSEEELAHDDFKTPPSPEGNPAQRHRNFFTMVFSNDGELLVWRDALILDAAQDPNEMGDATGLAVAPSEGVAEYHVQGDANTEAPIDPRAALRAEPDAIPFLVVDAMNMDVALNFPSVDGLLVYNDALFRSVDLAAQQRDFLLRTARPFYVNRNTGAVIRGPSGENVP